MGGKWLQLLKETAPHVDRVLLLQNAKNPNSPNWLKAIEPIRASLALQVTAPNLIEAAQIERLVRLRAERDGSAVAAALEQVRAAARGTANVLPPLKQALALRATVGEVCNALRDVWGVYEPSERF